LIIIAFLVLYFCWQNWIVISEWWSICLAAADY